MTTAPSRSALALRLPRGGRWLLGLVVPLLGGDDDGKQDRLQPDRRRASAILPLVSGGAWTAKDADKLRGGNLGKVFLEGHVRTIQQKKSVQCRK